MIGGALLFAGIAWLTAIFLAGRSEWISFLCTVTGSVAGLLASLLVLLGAENWEWNNEFLIGGQPIHLLLDGVSAIFLVLVSVIGGIGAAYAREYWSDRQYPKTAAKGRVWWNGLLLSMGFVLLLANGLHFLIAWEIFAICGYFLITLDNQQPEVRKAGWLYLGASHVGTLALFAFFVALSIQTGSWELGPMNHIPGLAPLFWLALFGFGMKAGFFPCHIWLPSAHANAPSHVSAIMSGVAIKMGIYGIVRFSEWLPLSASVGYVVIGIGAMSAILGIAFAFAQNDYKRLLAYCSVENIGIILIGLGGALLARTHGNVAWGQLLLAGAFLQIWNHGLFKSLLFFGAGAVLHSTGTREMSRLGGLWQRMPWTASLFALGVMAVTGLPPLNGFVSEWLIYLGLFEGALTHAGFAWAALPSVILLAMAGALALAAFVKAFGMIFLGASRTQAAHQAHECRLGMRVPMGVLAFICVTIGLAPSLFWAPIARATRSWNPAWTNDVSPFFTLGPAQCLVVFFSVLAGVLLWQKSQANGIRQAPTWDCGYASPNSRMQYTGGSFSGIIAEWFAWIFCAERKYNRPHGLFPKAGLRLERIVDPVLEKMIQPFAALIEGLSHAALGFQHGKLQAYILYLVVGIVALGIYVLLEGKFGWIG